MEDVQFLTEMFNLKSAKGYDYTISDKVDMPAMFALVWQATFEADNNQEYAIRVFRAKEYGKNARRIVFMRRKSKNLSANIMVDKGTFKKVLVTFMRCYEAYKDSADGPKASCFAVTLQKGVDQYASLFTRAIARIFRSEKKKQLRLVGVNEDGLKGTTELMMQVTQTMMPYWGGKEYDEVKFTTNAMYAKLSKIKLEDLLDMHEPDNQQEQPDIDTINQEKTNKVIDGIKKYMGNNIFIEFKNTVDKAKYAGGEIKGFEQVSPGSDVVRITVDLTGTNGNILKDELFYALSVQDFYNMFSPISASKFKSLVAPSVDINDIIKQVNNYLTTNHVKFTKLPKNLGVYSTLTVGQIVNDPVVVQSVSGYQIGIYYKGYDKQKKVGDKIFKVYSTVDELVDQVSVLSIGQFEDALTKILGGETQVKSNVKTQAVKSVASAPKVTFDDEDEAINDIINAPVDNNKVEELTYIKTLVDSGSSKFKAGDTGEIMNQLVLSSDAKQDYDILPDTYLDQEVYIVMPKKFTNKYVAIAVANDETYKIITKDEYNNTEGVTNYTKENRPATRQDAPMVNVTDYMKLVGDIAPIEFGPVSIKFNGVSHIDLIEKISELEEYFGSMPEAKLRQLVEESTTMMHNASKSIGYQIDKEIIKHGMHMTHDQDPKGDVAAYTGSSYNAINKAIRGDKVSQKKQSARIKRIDNIYKESGIKFPPSMSVYRGASIRNEEIEDLMNKKSYEFRSYTSTSLNVGTAYNFTSTESFKSKSKLVHNIAAYNSGVLRDEYFDSSQGNKILFDIDRLDRTLSLYAKTISGHELELEVLINRGTSVKMRGANQIIKLANRKGHSDGGLYFAKVSVSGDGNNVFEGTTYKYLTRQLNEAINDAQQTLDNVNMMLFFLTDVKEGLDSEE